MGTKHKRHRQSAPDQLFARAQRELAKGNAKEALKDAKVCYRSDASPQHRQLLEQAYLGRAQQLHGKRLVDEASAVLDELAALVPTAIEVNQQLARLRVLLGKGGAETTQLLEDDPSLLAQLVDDAVLDARAIKLNDARLTTQVEQVRQALLAVERGEDEAAAELVKDIPRNSPLSDWRLLVRGLSAFYLRDRERCDQNWRRLDSARPANRIAQTLLAAAHESPAADVPADIAASLQRLEWGLQAVPVSAAVKKLAGQWRDSNWQEFLHGFRALRQQYAKSHARLIESIVDLAWKRAVRDDDYAMLDQLIRIGPAPPLDPRWNRARAFLAEQQRPEGSVDGPVVRFWTAYARDVMQVEALPPAERSIAAALVYQHLARLLVRCADAEEHAVPYFSPDKDADKDAGAHFRSEAARCYRKSIESFERLESAYTELASLHERQEELDKSAAVLKRLLNVIPNNYEAFVWLGNYYLGQDQPEHSEQYVNAAVRLHPRDERTVTLQWNQRVTMVRCLTKARQFAAAHRELDEATDRVPANVEPYTLFTMRAGIEWKAKRPESAQQHLDAALGTIEEPTAIWLQMSLTAARYNLRADVKKDFDHRFKQAIEHPPAGQTAGRLARFFAMLRGTQTNYTGRATQERLFLKYLHRARPEQFAERDLCDVCQFLGVLDKDWELRSEFIMAGARQFPDCARLQLLAGDLEMEPGPFVCDFRAARFHMQRALELTRDSRQAADEEIVERAQRALALLDGFEPRMSPFLFDDEDLDEDEDDEDLDGDEDDEDELDDEDEDDDFDDEYDEFAGGCGEPRYTFESPGATDLERLFASMQDSLPPELVDVFKRIAAMQGVRPLELIQRIIEHGPSMSPDETDGRRPRRRRGK